MKFYFGNHTAFVYNPSTLETTNNKYRKGSWKIERVK